MSQEGFENQGVETPPEPESEEDKDKRIEELERRIAELEKETREDSATGLLSRTGFFEEAGSRFAEQLNWREEQEQRERIPEPMNIVFVDLNGFKPINDNYGHEAGDKMLEAVAQQLRDQLRDSDVIARIGGDEFLVAFTGDTKARETVRYKVKEAIESATIEYNGEELSVGTSVGAATHEPGEELGETIKRADAAMYEQKPEGSR